MPAIVMHKTYNFSHRCPYCVCDTATDMYLTNKGIPINSIMLNSYQKRKSNYMVHLDYIYCIIKYITARRKYLLYLSIDKNQLNQCKDWENFPQINLCFHVLYALFFLLPQHLLAGVGKTHVDMHPPPLHFHSAIQ